MKGTRIRIALAMVCCAVWLVSGLAPVLRATSAWAASPVVEEAQKLYDAAKFNDAVAKLRDGLGTGQITGNDVVAGRALLARCLVKSGNRLEAKQAFKTVLRTDPAYRPDAVMVPPDEMDVFNLALKEVTAEQIEAGQRIPASIAFQFGTGSGDNKSLADIQHFMGGSDKLDSKTEISGSVRFPLRPRLSLDLELARFRATGKDSSRAPNDIQFEATATPIVVSLYWAAISGPQRRVNLFVGGGPLLSASNSLDLPFFTVRIKIADEKTGTYFHGGAEGEWLLTPKVAVTGRALFRSATATKLYDNTTVDFGTSTNPHPLKDRKVDFSGYGVFVGLRAYIGY
jgi:hypothetical protein